MGLLDKLLGKLSTATSESSSSASRSHAIGVVQESLKGVPKETAEVIAYLSCLMGRVAFSDLEISDDEMKIMKKIIVEKTNLSPEEADLSVQITKQQNELFGNVDDYLVAREYRQISTKEEREKVLHCLFAVAAADERISLAEDQEIMKISEELGFSQMEFTLIRTQYSGHRAL